MTYTVIYFEDAKRTWKRAGDLETAIEFGEKNSDKNSDYDICVSLYEYDKLREEINKMKQNFKFIKEVCEQNQ